MFAGHCKWKNCLAITLDIFLTRNRLLMSPVPGQNQIWMISLFLLILRYIQMLHKKKNGIPSMRSREQGRGKIGNNLYWVLTLNFCLLTLHIFVSIVVSIPACHAGDRGSIPRQRDFFFNIFFITKRNFQCFKIIRLISFSFKNGYFYRSSKKIIEIMKKV